LENGGKLGKYITHKHKLLSLLLFIDYSMAMVIRFNDVQLYHVYKEHTSMENNMPQNRHDKGGEEQ
jgi:hypothetical protein